MIIFLLLTIVFIAWISYLFSEIIKDVDKRIQEHECWKKYEQELVIATKKNMQEKVIFSNCHSLHYKN